MRRFLLHLLPTGSNAFAITGCWHRAARQLSGHRRERLWPCPPATRWRGSRPQRLSSAQLALMRSSARAAAQAGCVWCRRWLGHGNCPRPAARCCRRDEPRHDRPCAHWRQCFHGALWRARVCCGRNVGQAPNGPRANRSGQGLYAQQIARQPASPPVPAQLWLANGAAPAHNLPGQQGLKISISTIDRLAGASVQRGYLPQEAIDDLRRLGAAADKR